MTRFLIFSTQRSGTHFLASLLQSSPSVLCLGEVFHHRDSSNNFYRAIGLSPNQLQATVSSRSFRKYSEFELAVRDERRPAATSFGPIVMYNQFERLPDKVKLGLFEGRRIIHLQRKNFLRTHVSDLINNLPNAKSHLRERAEIKRIEVPIRDLFASLHRRKADLERKHAVLSKYSSIETIYENLVIDPVNEVRRLCGFLEIDSFIPSTTLVRSNPSPLNEIITNYAEVHSALVGTEFEELLFF